MKILWKIQEKENKQLTEKIKKLENQIKLNKKD